MAKCRHTHTRTIKTWIKNLKVASQRIVDNSVVARDANNYRQQKAKDKSKYDDIFICFSSAHCLLSIRAYSYKIK